MKKRIPKQRGKYSINLYGMSLNCILAAFSPHNLGTRKKHTFLKKKNQFHSILESILHKLSEPKYYKCSGNEFKIRKYFQQAQSLFDELYMYENINAQTRFEYKNLLCAIHGLLYNDTLPCLKVKYAKHLLRDFRMCQPKLY